MIGRSGQAANGCMARGLCALVAAWCAAACWVPSAGAADRAAAARRPVVDPAVVQAGGACRGCRDPHCRSCRLHHHHAGCREGLCHPHCPVRPQEFGFYGTQWRRWPGQGVVPVAAVQEGSPTLPPKSAVPGPDEESRGPRPGDLPAPEPDAVGPDATEPVELKPAEPTVLPDEEPAPLPTVEPTRPAVPEPPAGEPDTPAPPAAEPPAKAPGDDNLFDESATAPARRRFVARRPAAAAADAQPPVVRPATLTYPLSTIQQLPPATDGWKPRVPPVPFDPAAAAEPRR